MAKTLLPSICAADLRRAEDAQTGRLESIDDARRQRILRADDGEADLLLLGEADELVEIVRLDRHIDAVAGGAGVARAQNTVSTRGDCASFQTSACSRPPLPITRTFIFLCPWRRCRTLRSAREQFEDVPPVPPQSPQQPAAPADRVQPGLTLIVK